MHSVMEKQEKFVMAAEYLWLGVEFIIDKEINSKNSMLYKKLTEYRKKISAQSIIN